MRSELAVLLRRRRNQALLAVLASLPVVIAAAVKSTSHQAGQDNDGGSLFASITDNGLFVAYASLQAVMNLFLPIAVSVVAGDAIAGEANAGTLRYLLTVPVGRTRLLVVKYLSSVIWCYLCAAVIAAVGVLAGVAFFGGGNVTLLSGTSVTFTEGVVRLGWIVAYLGLMLAVIAAIGLFISTLTEVPVAAMAATLVLVILSEVLDVVPALHSLHPWLFSHYWSQFADLLRDPIPTEALQHGCAVAVAYIAVFWSAAWVRFGGRDITS